MSDYLEELHTRLARIRAGRQALGHVDKTTPELIAQITEIEDYVRRQIGEQETLLAERRKFSR